LEAVLETDNTVAANRAAYSDESGAAFLRSASSAAASSSQLHQCSSSFKRCDLIEKSSLYTSPAQLDQLVEVAAQLNAPGEKIISIAYGRDSLIIGSITIDSTTTYGIAKVLIAPVVREYLSNSDATSLSRLVENFTIMDPDGKVVNGDDITVSDMPQHADREWSEYSTG
jgi:hypothetical protein